VVDTSDEVWSEQASFALQPGVSAAALLDPLAAAIRSGGLPNLQSAADELATQKLLLDAERGTLAIDRVLGNAASPRTRHAAALYGGAVLHERFAVRSHHLLITSGAHAGERLARLAADRPARPLPVELEKALAAGRGKAGFLFLDLTALWRPYLKAAQVTQSPLAELVARNPALFKERRALVLTLERGPAIDATVTMPPATFAFLLAVIPMLASL
jgi:hypothetical protein